MMCVQGGTIYPQSGLRGGLQSRPAWATGGLSLFLRFNGHFPAEPGLAGVN